MIAAPFVRTAHAAGKLSLALWDHWVPTANNASKALIEEWGAKEKVEVQIDYVTTQGGKLYLTIAAEAQAKSGHDIVAMPSWWPHENAGNLEPVDDVMDALIKQNGPVNETVIYLGRAKGRWLAVPATIGSQIKGPCSRIDLMKQHAGIDVQAMYPAGAEPKADNWTFDTFLKAAEACHKAGFPFGIGLGTTSDSVDTAGAIFRSFGATLVDTNEKITVKTDEVRQALDYFKRLAQFFPPDAPAWDDSSNNKWLVSGKGALILNPPSAWAVAKRDAPAIAADTWHFPTPRGKMGRLVPHRPYFWGVWKWAQNKPAAMDLLAFVNQREVVSKLSLPAAGYDIPPFLSMSDLPVWSEIEPPKGTIYNYPLRPHHDAEYYIVGSSAPPDIGVQIWSQNMIPQMVARIVTGQTDKQVIAWAKQELEGIRR
jgi:ABC-type glycerol-3-phosphate transport system substrate-binding protein